VIPLITVPPRCTPAMPRTIPIPEERTENLIYEVLVADVVEAALLLAVPIASLRRSPLARSPRTRDVGHGSVCARSCSALPTATTGRTRGCAPGCIAPPPPGPGRATQPQVPAASVHGDASRPGGHSRVTKSS
jgi:hypothetical protein